MSAWIGSVAARRIAVSEAQAAEARFWSHVWRCRHPAPCQVCCWPWLPAYRKALRRPYFPAHGTYHVSQQLPAVSAPRWAYILTHGALLLPFRQPLQMCHRCDFPPCCNPTHLFLATAQENIRDSYDKGHRRDQRQPITLPDGLVVTAPFVLCNDPSLHKETTP